MELLRQNGNTSSPQFGATNNSRFLSSENERISFGRDSKGPLQSDAKADSQLSTDRHHEPPEERMGPKHISFFRFSNKKKGSQRGAKLSNIADEE